MDGDRSPSGLVTPEAVSLDLDLAGVGSRSVGAIVDGLIQGALLIAGFVAGSLSPAFGEGFGLVVVGVIFFTLVVFGYHGIFEGLWEGQTPGKRVARIRVVGAAGQPVTWRQVVIRSVFRLIDMSPIGVVTIILTRRSQRLGDLAAGTVVIREQKVPEPAELRLEPDPVRDEYARSLDASGLSEQEYGLVRSFLQRRKSLQPEAAAALASQLATPLRARLGREPGEVGDQQFLEALLVAVRESAAERNPPA